MPPCVAALLAGMLAVCLAVGAGQAQDARIATAFELIEAEDFDAAVALAEVALADATTTEDALVAKEALAVVSYLTDDLVRAIATLTGFDAEVVAAYGWDDTRRIDMLDRLVVLHEDAGNTQAARIAALRQVHLTRQDPDRAHVMPYALQAAAVLERAGGDLKAAALLSLEAAFLAVQSEGIDSPVASEAVFLHAEIHLDLDEPVRALAWAAVVEPDESGSAVAFEDAFAAYQDRHKATAEHVARWHAEAAHVGLFDATDFAQSQSDVFTTYVAQGDLVVAEKIVEQLRTIAHPTETAPLDFCDVLAFGQPQARVEDTLAGLECLASYPPSYIATRFDLVGHVRRADTWLFENAQQTRSLPLLRMAHATASILQGTDSYEALGLLGLEADALLTSRNFAAAGDALAQILASPAISDMPELAFQNMIRQGEMFTTLNQPQDAEAVFLDTATLFDTGQIERDTRWTSVLELTARARVSLGDIDGAIDLYQQAVTHEVGLGDPVSTGAMSARFGLAAALKQAGRTDEALAIFEESRDYIQGNTAIDPALIASWQLFHAELLEDAGRSGEARSLLAAASPDSGQSQSTSARMQLAWTKALVAFNADDLDAASPHMDEALALIDPNDPLLAQLLMLQARIAARKGDDVVAIELLRQVAREARKPGRGGAETLRETLPLYVEIAIRLAQSTPDPASTRYLAEGFKVAQEYKSLSAGAAIAQAAVRWDSEPQLADMVRQLQDSDLDIEARNTRYRQALSKAEETQAIAQDIATRVAAHADLKAALESQFPEYAQLFGSGAVGVTELAAQLAPDEVLLLFVTSDDDNGRGVASSTILGVSQDAIMSGGTLPRSDLEDLATRLRCQAALTDPNCARAVDGTRGSFDLSEEDEAAPTAPAFDLAVAHEAYQALIAPMAPILAGKSRLIIVPDPSLVSVPFHTLVRSEPDGDTTLRTADWLIRDTTVFVVPTVAALSSLRARAATPTQGRFLGIGDPLIGRQSAGPLPYDCGQTPLLFAALDRDEPQTLRATAGDSTAIASLSALPDTRCELRAAAAYFGQDSTLLLHADATEARIKDLNASGALAQYQTISFATHGLIAGELGTNEAGIVLTPPARATADDDGLLTTGDIAELNLNADMVLLSACNTAAGSSDNAEGLSGLASAFFYAGARSILVSHWPVYSDAATQLTTGTLARRKADQKLGYADALRQTMLAVLDDPTSDARQLHPAYWAPFMVVGEGASR